jgi:putative membrane protein
MQSSSMRLILIVSILLVVVIGAVFAALNPATMALDFYFVSVSVPSGVALLCCTLLGWLLGGLVAWFGQVPRLRRELRAARQALRAGNAQPERDQA